MKILKLLELLELIEEFTLILNLFHLKLQKI